MKPIAQENDRLGFVGIGYMGRPIARRLLESGFRLTAYDRNPSKSGELIPYGGKVAQSVAELSSSCNVVLSCLPSDQAVLNMYKEPNGVFANAHRGSRVIDLSTVHSETSQELSRLGSEHGIEVLDVTISGSTPAAENGLLTSSVAETKNILTASSRSFALSPTNILTSGRVAPERREACGGHVTWHRNAGDCRSCRARRESWS
jgi:3-hydroxyisobutyrate dehydrogenase-like beta-hydroxyacid dehydrogenase